jgi:hypothetical protein
MHLPEDHRSGSVPLVPDSKIGQRPNPILAAAIELMQRNYTPRESEVPVIDLPIISEERMHVWKSSLAALGSYRGVAVYLITNYECHYGHAMEGEVLHTLLRTMPWSTTRLSELSAEDLQKFQEALSPDAQGMRLIASKLQEFGLELYFSVSDKSPYIAYTVLALGIRLWRDKQKGMVLPL